MKRHNWDIWKDRFVRGSDEVTLKSLSLSPNAPSYATIRTHAGREKWEAARQEYRDKVTTKTQEIAVQCAAEVKVSHAQTGRQLMQLASAGLARLLGDDGANLDKLKPRELLAMMQLGADLQRRALGLDTLNLNLKGIGDVTQLSDDELAELRAKIRQIRAGIGAGSTTKDFGPS